MNTNGFIRGFYSSDYVGEYNNDGTLRAAFGLAWRTAYHPSAVIGRVDDALIVREAPTYGVSNFYALRADSNSPGVPILSLSDSSWWAINPPRFTFKDRIYWVQANSTPGLRYYSLSEGWVDVPPGPGWGTRNLAGSSSLFYVVDDVVYVYFTHQVSTFVHRDRVAILDPETGDVDEIYSNSSAGSGWDQTQQGARPHALAVSDETADVCLVYMEAGSGNTPPIHRVRVIPYESPGWITTLEDFGDKNHVPILAMLADQGVEYVYGTNTNTGLLLRKRIDGSGPVEVVAEAVDQPSQGVFLPFTLTEPEPEPPVPVCFWTDIVNATQVCSTPPGQED